MRRLLMVAGLLMTMSLGGAMTAQAESGSASFQYLAGTGFICGLEAGACPDIARASNGDTIEIAGSGMLAIHPKSVAGSGSFTHKDAAGNVRASGTWTATQLLSFNSYGTSPGLPPNLEGGLALIRVHLSPGFDGVLQIDCGVGNPPPGHPEGIRLAVDNGLNFNQKVSGLTVFIRQ